MEMVEIDDGLKLSLSLKSYETRESQTSPPATLQLSLGRSSPSSFDFGQHQGRQISLFKDWIIFAGQRNPSIVEKTSKISPHSSSAMIDAGPSSALPPSPTVIELDDHDHKRVSSPNSTSSSVKGAVDREAISTDEEDGNAGGGNGGGGGGGGGVERKKLRLTKEQSVVLENTFREQTTLNTKQKVTLAKKLNLRPRQVEVWFQNRRARTKLKQTEVDCEYLKRCCESLTDENRRLQKELSELKTLKLSPEHYTNKNPPTTLSLCPSCARSTASPNFASSSSSHLSAVAQSSVPTANWYRGHAKVAVPVNNSELLRM